MVKVLTWVVALIMVKDRVDGGLESRAFHEVKERYLHSRDDESGGELVP